MPSSSSGTETRVATPFTFSQSSLQDYSDCPRRFQLRYIDHMVWPAVQSETGAQHESRQSEGLYFHRLIQQHLLGISPERLAALAVTTNLGRWWQNYLSAEFNLHESTQRTEVTLSSPVGAHRLLAKYDLVSVRSASATIYDWKTCARRPRDEWLAGRWQTHVYRALLARAGDGLNSNIRLEPPRISMLYWFADFPHDSAVFNYDSQQCRRDWLAIERLVDEISSARAFPRTEDCTMCRFCVFRSYCDRGVEPALSGDFDEEADGGDEFNGDFDETGEMDF
jgi:hypothetical protein